MKKTHLIIVSCIIAMQGWSQYAAEKQFNFSSFTANERRTSALQDVRTADWAKKHPEYGRKPYDSQCIDCAELIDRRTQYSRQFFDTRKPNHSYSQQSYFPLHYRDSEGWWRTIDPRLKPLNGREKEYAALDQEIPLFVNLKEGYTALDLGDFLFIHNHLLRMYFTFGKNGPPINASEAVYDKYTIGDDGFRAFNIWQGIDMEAFARTGEMETNFIVLGKPSFPAGASFMVIEDHVSLPEGYTIIKAGGENAKEAEDLLIKDQKGRLRLKMGHLRFRNAKNQGDWSEYIISKNGNQYTIRMLVPTALLDIDPTSYPLVIDPIVTGFDTLGNFTSTHLPSAGMLFTKHTVPPGHCDYRMTVDVPGQSQLVSSFMDLEATTTSDINCLNPYTVPPVVCVMSDLWWNLISDTCHVSINGIKCFNPSGTCDTAGTVTTDPRTVTGAAPIPLPGNLISCLQPQCPDFLVPFTLQNSDSFCFDTCNSKCAIGNRWKIEIEACTVDGYITCSPTVCAGQAVRFICHPSCGVPPYHYQWSNGMTGDTITIYPQQAVIMACTVYDACNNYALTNDTTVQVLPTPPASAGPDVRICEGGTVTIGGSPTTSPNTSISWWGSAAIATSWISDTNAANPTLSIPAGTVDTTYYVVMTDSASCYRLDTTFVYSLPDPVAKVHALGDTLICNGNPITIQANGPFRAYLWNNNHSGQSITVNTAGSYFVVVTDSNGCSANSDTVNIATIQMPDIHVFPDTLIYYGDSVGLYTDVRLAPPAIDSFYWWPDTFISCIRCPGPVVAPSDKQVYYLTVYTQGCVLTDSAIISVILPNHYFIPNAFTPNGDGINDSFYISGQSGVTVHSFKVYDRWGEKVHDGAFPWDGKYRGETCLPGIYVYIASIGLFGQQDDVLEKGSVTLIR